MLSTVSTIKDTPGNVEEFLARNLAAGVDHMFVAVDSPEPEVEELLAAHPHATLVRGYGDWWSGRRPAVVTGRQRANANVVKDVLALAGWPGWLFHIDGDECLLVDRAELAALPESVRALRARPLEAVARWEPTPRPRLFKRLLEDDELHLLATLGIIGEPRNQHYFHGHVSGKSGLRITSSLWMGTHSVNDANGTVPDELLPDWAELLHYESTSGVEFVRKWTALLSDDQPVKLRGTRSALAAALRALRRLDLAPEQREQVLAELFDRTTRDDVDALQRLGLLLERDPLARGHRPVAPDEGLLDRVHRMLGELSTAPKQPFLREGSPRARQRLLSRAADTGGVAVPSR